MTPKDQSLFAELAVDRFLLESFPNEASPYFAQPGDRNCARKLDQYRARFRWHIARSLSSRQKEVVRLTLLGKTQGEIGAILGITQQVVSIYKQRTINKLRVLLAG